MLLDISNFIFFTSLIFGTPWSCTYPLHAGILRAFLICIGQIIHRIRARSTGACFVFGKNGEWGFDIIDLTFFGHFLWFLEVRQQQFRKINYRGDFQTTISHSYKLLVLRKFFCFRVEFHDLYIIVGCL